jgi:hypothetical protein
VSGGASRGKRTWTLRSIASRAESSSGTPLMIVCSAAAPNAFIRRTARASFPPSAKIE